MLTAAFFVLSLLGSLSAHYPDELKSNFELLSERDNNLGDPNYRLLPHVQPRQVYVHLDTFIEESRFNGFTEMVVETDRPLTQIVFHQKVVRILTVTVANVEGTPISLSNYETDDYFELIKLNFVNELPADTYTITISYLGQINENPFDRGFYKGYYFVGEEQRFYATTQFQPYHARKAFPCFDEPQFKSHFTISITRPIDFSESFSNMAINTTEIFEAEGRVQETFYRTPRVSAYLVAFHVSDFEQSGDTGTVERPFRIISRPNVRSQHDFAASAGVQITEELSNYLDYDYYTMGEGIDMKNDHIALPDFPSGAMENWGMVNYREAYLLNDDTNTNLANKISIATIIAHELGHKWFGNLVTCFWWSNLWLNESFASFFEYFGAHAAIEELELDSQFIIDYVHSALLYDAGTGATAMNLPVDGGPSISAHFSTASYAKGASVLRMLEHFVEPTTFRKALRQYLRNNEYQVGTPELLYQEFSEAVEEDGTLSDFPDVDIAALFENWVENVGAPVLEVTVDNENGQIALAQRRYSLVPDTATTTWQIPLTWTRGGSPDFTSTKPTYVMTQRTDVLTKPAEEEWVIFNNQQSGYYRVIYDEHNYELIAAALLEESTPIHRFNRAQIVNDALIFLRGRALTPQIAFNVIAFLRGETDYYVWAAALGQLEWIRRRMDHIPQLQQEFEKYLLIQLEAVIEDLGFSEIAGESTATTLNRMQIMNLACNIGHEGCIENSLQLWNAYKADRTAVIPANLRRYVYCIGLRNGDRTDYDILYNLYLSSDNTADMVIILRALGCTRNTQALNDYLIQSLENDHIRYHDRTNAFLYALQGNPENVKVVLPFVQENYQRISESYGGVDRLGISLSNLATFLTDFDDVVEFQAWLYGNQQELDRAFNNGVSAIRTSVSNMEWGNEIALNAYEYLRAYNGVENIIGSSLLIFVAVIFNFLR